MSIQNLIHTPADMMTDYVGWYESILENPGVTFGVPGLDDVLTPMRPGNFIPILARSSHLKTTTAAILAKAEAQRILQREAQDKEIVMFITWEQSAEEITNLLLADGDYSATDVAWGRIPLKKVRAKAILGVHTPIWIIGNGIAKGDDTPRMYPETVFQIIEQVEKDYGRKPTLAVFDYLQLIPVQKGQNRVEQVMEATIRIKEVALRAGVPAVAAVQARQEVDDRGGNKFPTMRDAGWSKSIIDTADKAISIWYPCRTNEIGDLVTITVDGKEQTFTVTENLVFFRVLKQRFAPGFGTFAYHVNPGRLQLKPHNGEHIDLEGYL